MAEAEVTRATCSHTFRHSFATHLLKVGKTSVPSKSC
nr:hypothetical protein [Synechococcus sp. MW101C3]